MKLLAPLAALALAASPLSAQTQRVETPTGLPVKVQLDAMPLGALATMLMRDVMRVPYVISADVLNDHRPVSLNLVMRRSELPVRVVRFLRSQGLTVGIEGGTVYVSKGNKQAQLAPGAALPSGSPFSAPPGQPVDFGAPGAPAQAASVHSGAARPGETGNPTGSSPTIDGDRVLAVIRPAHRPVLELAQAIGTLLPGLDVAARTSQEASGTTILTTADPDTLSIGGDRRDVALATALVRNLDKPRAQVEIRAVVFEVRSSDSKASALSLLAKIAGVELEAAAPVAPGSQLLRLAASGFSAVLSATRTDGRFKVVAEPSLAALSGSTATINAGSQVPTLGAVTFTEQGNPVRSVVYRDSGVSLTVKPDVRGGEIELSVQQERSSFGRTTTGVDDSPTLNRAAASAQVSLKPGEAVILAGLDEKSESDGRQGFLGGILSSKSRDRSDAQLVLMLQADLAPARPQGETGVVVIEPENSTQA